MASGSVVMGVSLGRCGPTGAHDRYHEAHPSSFAQEVPRAAEVDPRAYVSGAERGEESGEEEGEEGRGAQTSNTLKNIKAEVCRNCSASGGTVIQDPPF